MRLSSSFLLLLLASSSGACSSGNVSAVGAGPGQSVHVAPTDVLEVTFEAGGGAPSVCPDAAGVTLGRDYRIDFAAGTIHVGVTSLACDADAGSYAHATHDVALGKADAEALLSLANRMVVETVTQCYEDGQLTFVTVVPARGASERYVVGEGGQCTLGSTEIRGAEFNAFSDKLSTL